MGSGILLLFTCLAKSHQPVVIVPGLIGVPLIGKVNKTETTKRCPIPTTSGDIWLDKKYASLFMYHCLLEWMTLDFDEASGESIDPIDFSLKTRVFGPVESLYFKNPPSILKQFTPNYKILVEKLNQSGYSPNKDLFAAPFDWRRGYSMVNWSNQFRELIEAQKQPVRIIAHSLGAAQTTFFLQNEVSQEWIKEHIKSLVFIAPTWGGSAMAAHLAWVKSIPFVKFLNSQAFKSFLESSPLIFSLFPNGNVLNSPVFIGPDKTYKPEEAFKLFVENNRIDQKYRKMAETFWNRSQMNVKLPSVPTTILYTSTMKTTKVLRFNSWDTPPSALNGDGDVIVDASSIETLCSRWKKEGHTITCHNFKEPGTQLNHFSIINEMTVIDKILQEIGSSTSSEL